MPEELVASVAVVFVVQGVPKWSARSRLKVALVRLLVTVKLSCT